VATVTTALAPQSALSLASNAAVLTEGGCSRVIAYATYGNEWSSWDNSRVVFLDVVA